MDELIVNIVQLEPMRAVTTVGFGQGPEEIAWNRMTAWAKQKGLWKDGKARRFFGMDTSSPSPASPNYGYQVWMTVEPEVAGEGEITVTQMPGGLYAVTRVVVHNPWEDIPSTWKRLMAWVEKSPYQLNHQQCYEETFWSDEPDYHSFTLDLFLPVRAA